MDPQIQNLNFTYEKDWHSIMQNANHGILNIDFIVLTMTNLNKIDSKLIIGKLYDRNSSY
jgi:hypothetical protein